ncbi:hypothetical protein [Haloarchaeobius sp. DFWS5]|uniref:hypothetical protein n=1 Tax=Haloarchaeobius sp. DFWS5 TaxID=3446114 RepID=UPI003EBA5FB5
MASSCPHCDRTCLPVGVRTTVSSTPIAPAGGGDEGTDADSVDGATAGEREVLHQRRVDLADRTVVVRAVALRPDDPEPVVAQRCPSADCPGHDDATERIVSHLDRLAATYRD